MWCARWLKADIMLKKTYPSPSLDIISKLGDQMKPIITKQENSKFERINLIALKLRRDPTR